MDFSLILTWTGVPFFFISLASDLVSMLIYRSSFHSSGFLVLGMMESYVFLLSILLRMFFTSSYTQSLISQGLLSIFGSFFYGFIVFLQLETTYNFFELVPNGIKILTILSWMSSNILFGLIAGDKFNYEIQVDNRRLSGHFFLDLIVILLSLSKVIHTINRLNNYLDFSSFSAISNFTLLIGSSLWAGSLIFDSFISGPSVLLLNLGKAGISITGVILTLVLIILKKRLNHQEKKFNSFVEPELRNSIRAQFR